MLLEYRNRPAVATTPFSFPFPFPLPSLHYRSLLPDSRQPRAPSALLSSTLTWLAARCTTLRESRCHHVLEAHQECVALPCPAARLLCVLVLTRSAELKETHLAPLANTFSRSSSTSTIVDQQTPKASTSPANSNAAIGDPNGIGASESLHALPCLETLLIARSGL